MSDHTNPLTWVRRNFAENNGDILIEQVRAAKTTCDNARLRTTQKSTQIYYCIMKSMYNAGMTKIGVWSNLYTVGGQGAGIPLSKLVIKESDVDTHATASNIRIQLASLDKYMITVSSDIMKFNTYVNTLIKFLHIRNQTLHDNLTHLFKGYKAATNKEFVKCIYHKEEDHKK